MAVLLGDYSKTAAQKGWGAGWPSCSGATNNLATVTFARSQARVTVHKRIARLVQLLADETERRGYLAKPGQTGAYNCRAISGTSSPSNHSWGLAVDWNWQDNPYTTNYTLNHIPGWMPPLWNRYGFAWGGTYTGKKDFMHWEFMGWPADADSLTALAITELTATTGDDDLTPEQDAKLDRIFLELTQRIPNRADYKLLGLPEPAKRPDDTVLGWAANADARSFEARELAGRALNQAASNGVVLGQVLAAVKAAGVDPVAVRAAIDAALGGGLSITGTAVPMSSTPKGTP